MFSIQAKLRDTKEKLDTLRASGEIPAVFYGAGVETTAISVPLVAFEKVWREAGESSALKLTLGTKNVDVLIYDVQLHPVKNEPTHVDFLVIDMNKTVEVPVPLEFVGIAPAVKSGLGSLVKVLHEIEIEALPADLPQQIEVDISILVDLDSQITVADLKLPKGVTAVTKDTDIVAAIAAQQEEKESSEPIDLSAIEVEKKGKKEEEEGGEN